MSVTYYHSTNGVLRGETTGASSTDYMLDGMGSVSATVDQSQSVLATFRFRPFGERMSKTGTGTDPRFAWRSSASLVSNAVELFNAVVIPSMGYQMVSAFRKSGTFRDGGLGEDVLECGSPGAEWHKLIPQDVIIELWKPGTYARPCGQVGFQTLWKLKPGTLGTNNGAVIQQVDLNINFGSCNKSRGGFNCDANYVEAWTVTNGKFDNRFTGTFGEEPHQDDIFIINENFDCMSGKAYFAGKVGYYGGCTLYAKNGWDIFRGTNDQQCQRGPWGRYLLGMFGAPPGFIPGTGRKYLGYSTDCCIEFPGYSWEFYYWGAGTPASFIESGMVPGGGNNACKVNCG